MDTPYPNHPPLLTTHKQRDGVSSLNLRRYNCTASQAALRTAVQQARCPSSPTSRESKTQRAGANPAAHCGAWRANSFPSPIEQQRPIQQGTTQTQQRPATNTACHNCMNHAALSFTASHSLPQLHEPCSTKLQLVAPAAALAICLAAAVARQSHPPDAHTNCTGTVSAQQHTHLPDACVANPTASN